MNLLGAIGSLMEGSDLEEVLQTIYGPNTVKHIMTGKALSRAFHGHMLVDSALSSMPLSEILTEEKNYSLPAYVLLLYEELELHSKTSYDVEKSESLLTLTTLMQQKMDSLRCASLTSELWAEYLAILALHVNLFRQID